MNLLFVEDEPVLRMTCTDAAEMNGHTVRAAANALEGLRLFREWAPDAIVTDLLMPGMGGLEFIRIIRKTSPDLPILVLTALANEDAKRNAEIAGATHFFVKPVSALDLIAALEAFQNPAGEGTATG